MGGLRLELVVFTLPMYVFVLPIYAIIRVQRFVTICSAQNYFVLRKIEYYFHVASNVAGVSAPTMK